MKRSIILIMFFLVLVITPFTYAGNINKYSPIKGVVINQINNITTSGGGGGSTYINVTGTFPGECPTGWVVNATNSTGVMCVLLTAASYDASELINNLTLERSARIGNDTEIGFNISRIQINISEILSNLTWLRINISEKVSPGECPTGQMPLE